MEKAQHGLLSVVIGSSIAFFATLIGFGLVSGGDASADEITFYSIVALMVAIANGLGMVADNLKQISKQLERNSK